MTRQETASGSQYGADPGHAEAEFNLATMYSKDQGTPRDYQQAMALHHKAAGQDHARAQFNLGLMFSNGQGVSVDHAQALYWYRKAADPAMHLTRILELKDYYV